MEIKNKNPLSEYGVTDKEFEYFEKFYKFERMAYWKGYLIGVATIGLICILIAIIARFH